VISVKNFPPLFALKSPFLALLSVISAQSPPAYLAAVNFFKKSLDFQQQIWLNNIIISLGVWENSPVEAI
jgi:hypothetical protein